MQPGHSPHESLLLDNDAWLRALIRQLVRADHVDDVVQDTWMAALEARSPRSPRAWLATVARRLASRRRRSERRRLLRERETSRSGESPRTDDLVQHVELRQRITAAVLALDEPFRTTVLQRFYEGLTPQQIARRLDVPAATVRSRLHRALAVLRDAFAVHDDRSRKMLLAALPGVPRTRAALQVMLMSPKIKLSAVAAAIVALAGVATFWWSSQSVPEAPTRNETAATGLAGEARRDAGPGNRTDPARTPLSPDPLSVDAGPRTSPNRFALSGRVLDPEGLPLANAEIYRRDDLDEPVSEGPDNGIPLGTSGPDGSFELALENRSGWLAVRPPLIAVRPWSLLAGTDDVVIVATPAVSLIGVVTDPAGQPLPGVAMTGFCERLTSFPTALHRNGRPRFPAGVTDAQGRFSIARAPANPAVVVTFSRPGYRNHDLPGPTTMGEYHRVVLEPLAGDEAREIIGRVLDPERVPVAGATVRLGEIRSVTDALGAYRIEVPRASNGEVFFAYAGDALAAIGPDISRVLQGPPPHTYDFQLRAATAVISGHVIGPDGEPWDGVVVYPWDVEYLGSTQVTTEGFEVGADDEWIGNSALTGPDGRFELGGLDERSYRLRFLDRSMPFGFTSDPIPAGARDVEIRVPTDALREKLQGRIVDLRGRGVPDVGLEFMVPIRMRDGNGVSTGGGHVTTDEDGYFTMRNVPRESGNLVVRGELIVPNRHWLPDDSPDSGLEITVHRRCWFRVYAPQAPEGSEFEVLNEAGRALDVIQFTGGGRITMSSWELTDGRTEVLAVSEAAHWIVLRREGEEIARQRMSLQAEGTTEIRF